MKKQYRVTFYNMGTNVDNRRMLNIIKDEYWEKGKEPNDWESFDGDIEISRLGDRSGDCFELEMADGWYCEPIFKALNKNKDIRTVEIKVKNDYVPFSLTKLKAEESRY